MTILQFMNRTKDNVRHVKDFIRDTIYPYIKNTTRILDTAKVDELPALVDEIKEHIDDKFNQTIELVDLPANEYADQKAGELDTIYTGKLNEINTAAVNYIDGHKQQKNNPHNVRAIDAGIMVTDLEVSPEISFQPNMYIHLPTELPRENYYGDRSHGTLTLNNELQIPVETNEMVVRNYVNATIHSSGRLTTDKPCKGLLIYVDGILTLNGEIDMRGKGLPYIASGNNIELTKDGHYDQLTYESVGVTQGYDTSTLSPENTTVIARDYLIPSDTYIYKIKLHSLVRTNFFVSVVRRISAGSYARTSEIMTFTHDGTGMKEFVLPKPVFTGIGIVGSQLHLAVFSTVQYTGRGWATATDRTRAVILSNAFMSDDGQACTEDTGWIPAFQVMTNRLSGVVRTSHIVNEHLPVPAGRTTVCLDMPITKKGNVFDIQIYSKFAEQISVSIVEKDTDTSYVRRVAPITINCDGTGYTRTTALNTAINFNFATDNNPLYLAITTTTPFEHGNAFSNMAYKAGDPFTSNGIAVDGFEYSENGPSFYVAVTYEKDTETEVYCNSICSVPNSNLVFARSVEGSMVTVGSSSLLGCGSEAMSAESNQPFVSNGTSAVIKTFGTCGAGGDTEYDEGIMGSCFGGGVGAGLGLPVENRNMSVGGVVIIIARSISGNGRILCDGTDGTYLAQYNRKNGGSGGGCIVMLSQHDASTITHSVKGGKGETVAGVITDGGDGTIIKKTIL